MKNFAWTEDSTIRLAAVVASFSRRSVFLPIRPTFRTTRPRRSRRLLLRRGRPQAERCAWQSRDLRAWRASFEAFLLLERCAPQDLQARAPRYTTVSFWERKRAPAACAPAQRAWP